jgi:hypothetical protein
MGFGRDLQAPISACLMALVLLWQPSSAAAKTSGLSTLGACPSAGTESAQVASVDGRLDLALRDGRSLHLVGLDPVQATPDNPDFPDHAKAVLAQLLGRGISFLPLSAVPDRWARIPAFGFFLDGPAGEPAGVAEFLLAKGFARHMPTPESHACAEIFRGAEEKARAGQVGLWHDPYYAILAATNRAAFTDKAATNVIVEGRLVDVTSNHYRTSLEFAPRRDYGFTVTILQRNVAIFEQSGLHFRALIGRTLRVRGLLDLRFGPQIEAASADDIEVIAGGQNEGGVVRQSETNPAVPSTKQP